MAISTNSSKGTVHPSFITIYQLKHRERALILAMVEENLRTCGQEKILSTIYTVIKELIINALKVETYTKKNSVTLKIKRCGRRMRFVVESSTKSNPSDQHAMLQKFHAARYYYNLPDFLQAHETHFVAGKGAGIGIMLIFTLLRGEGIETKDFCIEIDEKGHISSHLEIPILNP